MNPIQRFLIDQKRFYAMRTAASMSQGMKGIKRMLMTNRSTPDIMDAVYEHASKMTNIFCQLLLANIEGMLLREIREGREHEKQDCETLYSGWDMDVYRERSPLVGKQIEISQMDPAPRDPAPIDEGVGMTE